MENIFIRARFFASWLSLNQISLIIAITICFGYSFLAAVVAKGADRKGSTFPPPTDSELDPEVVLLEASAFLSWSNCSPKSASSDNWLNILRSSNGFQLLGPGFELVPPLERKGLVDCGGRLKCRLAKRQF